MSPTTIPFPPLRSPNSPPPYPRALEMTRDDITPGAYLKGDCGAPLPTDFLNLLVSSLGSRPRSAILRLGSSTGHNLSWKLSADLLVRSSRCPRTCRFTLLQRAVSAPVASLCPPPPLLDVPFRLLSRPATIRSKLHRGNDAHTRAQHFVGIVRS